MIDNILHYEIRELPEDSGGLRLGLFIDKDTTPIATASASKNILEEMEKLLGQNRSMVSKELSISLEEFLKHRLPRIKIFEPIEDLPTKPLYFNSQYTYYDGENIQTGTVWYDVAEEKSGPDAVDSLIQSYMRREVNRKLTAPNSIARKLVG